MRVSYARYAAVSTIALLSLSSCGGSTTPAPIAVQQSHGQTAKRGASSCPCIYVANPYPSNSVNVYGSSATGNAKPIRVISGSNTGLIDPLDIAVDDRGRIYVANYGTGSTGNSGSVTVYAAGAKGNVAPVQTISGSNTKVQGPDGVALDTLNGHIYVSQSGFNKRFSVTNYGSHATGNVTPAGTIKGKNTGLAYPEGLTLDASGNIYVPNANLSDITVYAAGSRGDVAPIRTIHGQARLLYGLEKLALDTGANLYLSGISPNRIVVYAAGANGTPTPIRIIEGSNTRLALPWGVALDGGNNIYVANENGGPSHNGSITVYAPGTGENVPPVKTITGASTGLFLPRGIAIH